MLFKSGDQSSQTTTGNIIYFISYHICGEFTFFSDAIVFFFSVLDPIDLHSYDARGQLSLRSAFNCWWSILLFQMKEKYIKLKLNKIQINFAQVPPQLNANDLFGGGIINECNQSNHSEHRDEKLSLSLRHHDNLKIKRKLEVNSNWWALQQAHCRLIVPNVLHHELSCFSICTDFKILLYDIVVALKRNHRFSCVPAADGKSIYLFRSIFFNSFVIRSARFRCWYCLYIGKMTKSEKGGENVTSVARIVRLTSIQRVSRRDSSIISSLLISLTGWSSFDFISVISIHQSSVLICIQRHSVRVLMYAHLSMHSGETDVFLIGSTANGCLIELPPFALYIPPFDRHMAHTFRGWRASIKPLIGFYF